MSGTDGLRQVKVDMNGVTVLHVAVASPYGGNEVKMALRFAYSKVRQVYVLSRGLSFIKNNELEALVGFSTRGFLLVLSPSKSCSGNVPWCYYF